MSTVNNPNPNQEQTTYIFDKFYDFELSVDAAEYDVVLSYFRKIFTNDLTAKNFALNLFKISDETGSPAMEILESVKGQNALDLTSTFAYYLNNLRSNTTLLGISAVSTPAFYAARNVLV